MDYFEIDAQSGVVTQRRAIDRELYGSLELQVKAEEESASRRFQVATLTVRVDSVNEHAPQVRSSTGDWTAYIHENAARGTLVKNSAGTSALQLLVSDRDQVHTSSSSLAVHTRGSFLDLL